MSAGASLFARREKESGGHWLSVSDLMAGLMMIFLFIAIIYMREVQKVIVVADETHQRIYLALYDEFKDDLPEWNAEIDQETMTFRFNEPDVLFDQGGAELKLEFERILSDFFPRYVGVLGQFKGDIDEVRIEGHTSSEWRNEKDKQTAYFRNMELSQDRTRNVLEYCVSRESVQNGGDWINQKIAAVGLSSTKLIIDDGIEDRQRSRRVEFRVKTNFEQRIIEETLKGRVKDNVL
jgi:outer membrane protein OmpA-like peptidoglycan-associated protein